MHLLYIDPLDDATLSEQVPNLHFLTCFDVHARCVVPRLMKLRREQHMTGVF